MLPGKVPLERFGDGLVVLLKLQQAIGERLSGGEVVGRKHLSLHDREVDFDLIEPAGVNRTMHRDEIGVGTPIGGA